MRELDALAALGPIPADTAPLWHWRHVLLAAARGQFVAARDAAEQMDAALAVMGPHAVPEHQIMAHYDLAKFWSGQGESSRAFASWTAAHRLLARSQPVSRADHLAFVEANIRSFGRTRFCRRAARHECRSGADLHRGHAAFRRDIVRADTRPASRGAWRRRANRARPGVPGAGRAGHAGSSATDCIARCRCARQGRRHLSRRLHALAPGKTRIVDKMPGNFHYLGLVGLVLPGTKIIHCVREPRDIGLSIFTFRFYGLHGYAHDLGDLGWYIAQHDRLMAHWKAALPNPILTVQLSDWVRDFDSMLGRVLAHVGLPHDPSCARFYESEDRVRTVSRAQVRQPVNARGLGRWRAYADELAPLIAEFEQAENLAAWRDNARPPNRG
jgi:hypothetical protein